MSMKHETSPSLLQRFGSELVGTYILVAVLISAYFISMVAQGGPLTYAIVYAITLGLLIIFFGRWSVQFNPIVSFMMFVTRKMKGLHLLVAVVGQLVGSILAAFSVRGLLSLGGGSVSASVPLLNPESVPLSVITTVEGFGILLLLLAYVWGTSVASEEESGWFPLVAGASVIPGAVVGMLVSGGALNPIRVLGPAIIAKGGKIAAAAGGSDFSVWKYQWVYWVGPLLAALIVMVVVGMIMKNAKQR